MNNIQKMENKAYKAYVEKELKSTYIDNEFYNWVLSNNGRRCILKGIRKISKMRVETFKIGETKYDAARSQRDYSLGVAKSRGK